MTRRSAVELFFGRYGESVTVNGVKLSAMIRPLSYKSTAGLKLPVEFYDDLHYLYMGPAAEKPSAGGTLACKGTDYSVKRTGTVTAGGAEIYAWAVLSVLPPEADTEVYIESGGVKIASAGSYTAYDALSVDAVTPFGENMPCSVAGGAASYTVKLYNVIPEKDADVYSAENFSVVIKRGGFKTVYSGCMTKNIEAGGGVADRAQLSVEVLAAAVSRGKEG